MAVTKCGLVGGVTFYVDGSAPADGDGSLAAPWNNIDEALQNISTYQKNMSTYIYLNVKGTGNTPYPVTQSISYLSDFTIRSYGDWDSSPQVPETTKPQLNFTASSDHILHCENIGTNNINIVAGSIGAIDTLEIRYSFIGITDTNITANLKLIDTRLTAKTQFLSSTDFTGPSTTSTIELSKGSVLIVIDNWTLNGLAPSATIEPIFYNGGVLISDRITDFTTNKEPSVNPYAIGYYNPATIDIKIPSPADRTKKNLWLNWDGDASANSASFLPVTDCESIGCTSSSEITTYTAILNDPGHWAVTANITRIKTGTSKRLFVSAGWGYSPGSDTYSGGIQIPQAFRPKSDITLNAVINGVSAYDCWYELRSTGELAGSINLSGNNTFGNHIFRVDGTTSDNTGRIFAEVTPLNDL